MPRGDKQFHLMARARATGNRKGEVKVYSAIGTHKWDEDDPTVTSNDFDKELQALGDVDEITVRINSPGGVVTEAVAIRTALMKHKAKKTVDIEGCCDSAVTLIACMPGAHVRMARGGEYMIHCCSAFAWGQKDKIMSLYRSMEQTDRSMAQIYAERTGMTEEECLKLMEAETWYGAEEAKDAGFVDEIIAEADGEAQIAACAVDADTMEMMRDCYAHVPERYLLRAEAGEDRETGADGAEGAQEGQNGAQERAEGADGPDGPEEAASREEGPQGPGNDVSHERTAVAAGSSTENKNKGVGNMELSTATAEQIRQENPTVAQAIAEEAINAERARVREITALTRKGEKWQAMAKKAIEDGTSAADYLKAIIAEETKQGEDYLNARREELKATDQIGAGDCKDNDKDDAEAKATKAAKEIAELAKSMNAGGGIEMA